MGVCNNRVTIAGTMTEVVGDGLGMDLGIAEIGFAAAMRVACTLRSSRIGSMTES